MRAFLIDSLNLLDRKWGEDDCRRYCEQMVELHGKGHEWVVPFCQALVREAETGVGVDRAILESRRDSIVQKIQDIYDAAEARARGGGA